MAASEGVQYERRHLVLGDLMERMTDALEEAKTLLEKNRARMARRLESLRQQGVTIESMDWVMVESSGINSDGHELLSQKNRQRYIGPFKVLDADHA